jgi:hypothetical protein
MNLVAEDHVRWWFFSVFLALLPLILNLVIIRLTKIRATIYDLVRDGQLFFFSSALSASSIGILFGTQIKHPLFAIIIGCFLLTILILSAGLYSLASFLRLKDMEVIERKMFLNASGWSSVSAVFFSYLAFFQVN